MVLGVGKGVLFREVSSVHECPHREGFHCECMYIVSIVLAVPCVCGEGCDVCPGRQVIVVKSVQN